MMYVHVHAHGYGEWSVVGGDQLGGRGGRASKWWWNPRGAVSCIEYEQDTEILLRPGGGGGLGSSLGWEGGYVRRQLFGCWSGRGCQLRLFLELMRNLWLRGHCAGWESLVSAASSCGPPAGLLECSSVLWVLGVWCGCPGWRPHQVWLWLLLPRWGWLWQGFLKLSGQGGLHTV